MTSPSLALRQASIVLWAVAGCSGLLGAQAVRQPQPVPYPPSVAAPADTPFPGVISLRADLDTVHRVIHVTESIPVSGSEVSGGDLTLLYPQWIPGNHSPTGPIDKLAGLVTTANGQRVQWVRDPLNVYAFRVPLPAGATEVQVQFDYLTPVRGNEGRISFSSNICDLSWNTVVLYPAGHFSRDIEFSPAVVLPQGWKYATALSTASHDGDTVQFQNVPLNTLVDSPLYAGVNYRRIDLSPSPADPVFLNVFADTPQELAATPEQVQLHRNLAQQALRLFQSHHYDQYNFLFSLSDRVGGEGLEHHQSSEDGTRANYFTEWAAGVAGRDLLAHEYTHSWNGKFRRPAALWTPNFNVPMRDRLLWVYEGLTQYYGYVLTARSGLRTPEATRDLMARIAATFEASSGRNWRPLIDTTNQPTVSQRRPVSWPSWERGEDYYQEGLLIWLDADTKIRQLSHGAKSLDDFARRFFGVENGSFVTDQYTFDDIVAALNATQPYDWARFLHQRVDELAPTPPENGFAQGGYRLVYNDVVSPWMEPGLNFSTSLGVTADDNGDIANVNWGSPAFQAGLNPGMKIEAVDGQEYTGRVMRAALLDAEHGGAPIRLLVRQPDGKFEERSVDYHGGLRIPHLERLAGAPDLLDAILAPLP